MQVSVDPVEGGVHPVIADGVVDRRERCQSRVPHGLRVIAPEPLDELSQTHIGHHRQMRAGMSGVGEGAATPFEDDHLLAGFGQQVRRGEACYSSADNDDVGDQVVGESGKSRKRS